MKRQLTGLAFLLLLGVCPTVSAKQRDVVFEATVMRVEPWGPIKISCGVAIVYRLAEYRVDAVYSGRIQRGDHLFVQHLACNYDELEGLKPDDKVIVVAETLSKPEKRSWMKYPLAQGTDESVSVSYRGLKVAKLIYPTANRSSLH
jgi:hypothetical protein